MCKGVIKANAACLKVARGAGVAVPGHVNLLKEKASKSGTLSITNRTVLPHNQSANEKLDVMLVVADREAASNQSWRYPRREHATQ